jgi:hypothetical protein
MPPQATPPTAEQQAWLKANKRHVRTSHVRTSAKFTNRGTLRPDGTFVPETGRTPVMDGNGSFGVGVMIAKRRR